MVDSEQSAGNAASATEPQTLGQILRNARAARDLTIEQISAELRIEPKQLDALEQDLFERIGPPVFVRGYLRQYGLRLGLDQRELIAQYDRQTKLSEVEIRPSKTIRLHDERQMTVWIVAALVLLALIVALAMWWLNGGGFTLGPGSAAPAAVEKSAPAAVQSAPAAAQLQARPDSASSPVPAAASSAPPVDAAPAPPPAPAPAPAAEAAARAASPVPAASTAEQPPAAARTGAAAEAGRRPDAAAYIVSLDLTFDQESWTEVSDARGERLFYGLGAAGRKAQVRGEPPFAVVLGNSAGVRLQLDGEDYPVPTSGRPGESARFTVDTFED